MNQRQKQQQEFDQSEQNLIVGSEQQCPLSPEQLAMTTADSEYVVETFESGLTAQVFHIRIDGQDYTLKKKRPQAKVQNLDGQYSFLNEVQRRFDFQTQKNNPNSAPDFQHIVETIYANYRLGIIVSEWVEGTPVQELTNDLLAQIFSTLLACESIGLFEWDLCSGNLLVNEQGQLKLFDFGYMYRFEPLQHFNSNGLSDPLFDACERFETRFLSGWLLEKEYSQIESLQIFKAVKRQALRMLEDKRDWLAANQAKPEVIERVQASIEKVETALSSDAKLEHLFTLEMFRSHVLDIEDDLEGKSCTAMTIKRVQFVLAMLEQHYDLLLEGGALFYQNQGQSQTELIGSYLEKRQLVERYQL
ncbi:AarF/UbiB family protein [Vibrio hepatarius]|uniref:AarF/UbiB family protein n=1 Tax=Vibrio hepatarius TaxID=171383 RepID=UPI0037368210